MPIDSVTDVKIRWAPANSDNLIAWVSCTVNKSLRLDDIRVHRKKSGKMTVRYPYNRSRRGSRCHFFNPTNKETAEAIESAVLLAIEKARPNQNKGSDNNET